MPIELRNKEQSSQAFHLHLLGGLPVFPTGFPSHHHLCHRFIRLYPRFIVSDESLSGHTLWEIPSSSNEEIQDKG